MWHDDLQGSAVGFVAPQVDRLRWLHSVLFVALLTARLRRTPVFCVVHMLSPCIIGFGFTLSRTDTSGTESSHGPQKKIAAPRIMLPPTTLQALK